MLDRRARPGAGAAPTSRCAARSGRPTRRRTRHSSSRDTSRSTERGRARRPPRARDRRDRRRRSTSSAGCSPRATTRASGRTSRPALTYLRGDRARSRRCSAASRPRTRSSPTAAPTTPTSTRRRSCAPPGPSGCSSTTASPPPGEGEGWRRMGELAGCRSAPVHAHRARRRGGARRGLGLDELREHVRAEVAAARGAASRPQDDRGLPLRPRRRARPTRRPRRARCAAAPRGSRTAPLLELLLHDALAAERGRRRPAPRAGPLRLRRRRPVPPARRPDAASAARRALRDDAVRAPALLPVRPPGGLARARVRQRLPRRLADDPARVARGRDGPRGARARAGLEAPLRVGRGAHARAVLPRRDRLARRAGRGARRGARARRGRAGRARRCCARTRSRSTASTTSPSRRAVADRCSRRRPPPAPRACGRRCTARGARRRPRPRRSRGRR